MMVIEFMDNEKSMQFCRAPTQTGKPAGAQNAEITSFIYRNQKKLSIRALAQARRRVSEAAALITARRVAILIKQFRFQRRQL
jgi:hypothetical protein